MKRQHFLQLTIILFTLSSIAQTHTWTGNGGNNLWSNPDNWDVFTVPTATSDILISGPGINVAVQSSNNGATIVIQNGATLVVEANLNMISSTTIVEGTIEILNGGLYSNPGGTITIQPNAQLIIEGGVNSSGTITNSGTIEVTGDFTNDAGSIVIDPLGEFLFIDGSLSDGTITNNGLFQIEGMAIHDLTNLTLTNNANLVVTESNQTRLTDVTIENTVDGIIDIPSNGGFLEQNQNSVLNNSGVVRKIQGSTSVGNFYLVLEVNNSGTIEIEEDQTFLLLGANRPFVNMPSGTLSGNGAFDITADFTNQGTISPGGGDVGTLFFVNTFSLDNGTILLDFISENEHDRIDVLGSPEITGEFSAVTNIASVGDEFTVITSSNPIVNCDFPNEFYLSDGKEKMIFETSCETSSVVVTYASRIILDVEEFTEAQTIKVAPNPTTPETIVTIPQNFLDNKTKMEVFDVTGKTVLTEIIKSTKVPLNTSTLSNGLYFVRIAHKSNFLTTKIVVEH